MTPDMPVTEDELQAFVDGQLASGREEAVRRYLSERPDEARRISTYAAHRETLRAAFADAAARTPTLLPLSWIAAASRRPRFTVYRIAAMAVLAIGLGGVGGWFLAQPSAPSRDARAASVLTSQAFAVYAVFATDPAHPVEFTAAELPSLSHYLSERLGRPANPPSLESVGFGLIGGRIVATEYGSPAVLFVYQNDSGARLALLLRPMAPDLRWPMQPISGNGVAGEAWIGSGMGYAVVGSPADGDLGRVTDQIMHRPG